MQPRQKSDSRRFAVHGISARTLEATIARTFTSPDRRAGEGLLSDLASSSPNDAHEGKLLPRVRHLSHAAGAPRAWWRLAADSRPSPSGATASARDQSCSISGFNMYAGSSDGWTPNASVNSIRSPGISHHGGDFALPSGRREHQCRCPVPGSGLPCAAADFIKAAAARPLFGKVCHHQTRKAEN